MSMQAIPTDKALRRTFWQRQVNRFQGSNLTAAQFCREQGLPYQSFKNWKGKFAGSEQTAPPAKAPTKSFVQIQAAPITTLSSIKCSFPNGVEVSLDGATPLATVAALIREIQQI